MDIEGWDDEAGKRAWMDDPIWQGTRAVESIMGAPDYVEQYLAINLIFEPLVGELFRSGFLKQVAAANSDFVTPSVISAAEADYERNLANAIDFAYMLVNDPEHGAANRALFQGSPNMEHSPTRPPPGCARSGRSRIPSRSPTMTHARPRSNGWSTSSANSAYPDRMSALRAVRINMEFGGALCRGLKQHRYKEVAAVGGEPTLVDFILERVPARA